MHISYRATITITSMATAVLFSFASFSTCWISTSMMPERDAMADPTVLDNCTPKEWHDRTLPKRLRNTWRNWR